MKVTLRRNTFSPAFLFTFLLVFTLQGNRIASQTNSTMVPEFDWRTRHGANNPSSPYYSPQSGANGWMTSVKNQGTCNLGYIFSPIAALEAQVNLYFNRHIDTDLSEQSIFSCDHFGDGCAGGSSVIPYLIAKDSGIVSESCFPYVGGKTNCSDICAHPEERIKLGFFNEAWGPSEDLLKSQIINKGPIPADFYYASVGLTLMGWGVAKVGDTIYVEQQLNPTPTIIQSNSEYLGRSYWICKNSYGLGNGYIKAIGYVIALFPENLISSLKYTNADIACNDFDGDGYYYWGIGPKPPYCPPSPDLPDGDDSNPCIGPLDQNGFYTYRTPTPPTSDTTIEIGQSVNLITSGLDVKWYSDPDLTQLIKSGDTLSKSFPDSGDYYYYAIQTIDGCRSGKGTAHVHVKGIPVVVVPPGSTTQYFKVCIRQPIQLAEEGQEVRWYEEPANPVERAYDKRDGEVYETRKFPHPRGIYQIWTTRNMNYRTSTGSAYYKFDSVKYAKTYGRLYNAQGASEACPEGWQITTDSYDFLINRNGLENMAGIYLKESGNAHWKYRGSTGYDSGFGALPAGMIKDSVSFGLGELTGFWGAGHSLIVNWGDSVQLPIQPADLYQSVRCMKYGDNNVISYPPVHVGNTYTRTFYSPGVYKIFSFDYFAYPPAIPDTFIITVSESLPPVAIGDTIVYGETVPSLHATGDSIRWYSDKKLSNLIATGNVFTPSNVHIGSNVYFATQTIECEGFSTEVILVVKPLPPTAESAVICTGDSIPALSAIGTNIKWYDTTLVSSGNIFKPNVSSPGKYTYYVTQTVNYVESNPDTVILSIGQPPSPPVGKDVKTFVGLPVPYLTAQGENIKWYKDKNLTQLVGTGNKFKSADKKAGKYDYYATQTIGCESPADTVTLVIKPLPETIDLTACENSIVDLLHNIGSDIHLYADSSLTALVYDGIKFITDHIQPGIYYANIPVNGSGNKSIRVKLTVKASPDRPNANDVSVCKGNAPDLTAEGQDLKWYNDAALKNLLHQGNTFATGKTLPGNYHYYVTQSSMGCESYATPVLLSILKAPQLHLGRDTGILNSDTLRIDATNKFKTYSWFDGSGAPFYTLIGAQAGLGVHQIWVEVTDSSNCTARDTIMVTVSTIAKAHQMEISGDVEIYPNPSNGIVNIRFAGTQKQNVTIYVINENGKTLLQFSKKLIDEDEIVGINLSGLPNGTYIIHIKDSDASVFKKVFKID